MSDQPERTFKAMSQPMGTGPGMSAVSVSAPVGAVSRKTRERARRTALSQEGPTSLVLHTELRGTVHVQVRGDDGDWRTVSERRTALRGRTRLELPASAAGSPQAFRVVFSPRNANVSSWVSGDIPS